MIARAKPNTRPMPAERRGAVRQAINRRAQYFPVAGALPRDCMVVDISDTGARLYVETPLPDVFVLVISGETSRIERECRVVWRLGGECGVVFTRFRG
ncbi:MAG: PilZ domain-containing protein [Pseudolabrys sp.]